MGKKEKKTKTNAMRLLEEAGIAYEVHLYDVSDGLIDGTSVAAKCGEDPDRVFKTLVTKDDKGGCYVFIVPVKERLDLKAAAKSAGVKAIAMIPQKELFPLTGYVHGGCSPIGMKKLFPSFLDETALLYETVMVSGGRVGVQLEIKPRDLLMITAGQTAELCAHTTSG